MNRFEQAYLNIINEWNSNLLLEANLKSLIPNIQHELIGDKSYQDLTEQEKQKLQIDINNYLQVVEEKIKKLTDNKQYQSWIYNILKNQKLIMVKICDANLIKTIEKFVKLCKRPDLKPEQKNIENYKTLEELQNFVDGFEKQHKLSGNIYKNLKKVYSNDEFTVYFINSDQYNECNKLFGGNEYFNTGWCIAKNPEHFYRYINEYPDKYNGYFVFIKDNKPYALLHYGSYQFKDTSDETLENTSQNVLDCLLYINDNYNDYYKADLEYYGKQIFFKKHPNASKEDLIAFEIGGMYDSKTKIIDCKGNKVQFKEEWLDENGTFDFTFINATESWSYMFYGCTKLKKLPNNFTIPNTVTNCRNMFAGCENLEKLPDNFIIPNIVINCRDIFYNCKNLIKLPNNFTIPDSVKDCSFMFYNCINLTKLPDNFSIYDCMAYNIFEGSGLEGKYNISNLLR